LLVLDFSAKIDHFEIKFHNVDRNRVVKFDFAVFWDLEFILVVRMDDDTVREKGLVNNGLVSVKEGVTMLGSFPIV
jgi:hypothetical protein